MNIDLFLYGVHLLFWAAFGATRLSTRSTLAGNAGPAQPQTTAAQTSPWSRGVLGVHFLAFAVLYFGIGSAVFGHQVPALFVGQRIAGTLVIAVGAGLACWALRHFASWRLRASLEPGHRLATGGPFRHLRHPIYMGLNLLALGSAIWAPTEILWAATALMFIGSDLRGRVEEKLLASAFGATYTDYCRRTRRFLPWIY